MGNIASSTRGITRRVEYCTGGKLRYLLLGCSGWGWLHCDSAAAADRGHPPTMLISRGAWHAPIASNVRKAKDYRTSWVSQAGGAFVVCPGSVQCLELCHGTLTLAYTNHHLKYPNLGTALLDFVPGPKLY